MAKSKETYNKKSKEQKKQQQRREKQAKMEERKLNASKGKSLEDMIAYVDENGNLSDKAPDPRLKKVFKAEEIRIQVTREDDKEEIHSGTVQFLNEEKSFGFILDEGSKEKIFFHFSNLTEEVWLHDKVEYDLQAGERGWAAVNIKRKNK